MRKPTRDCILAKHLLEQLEIIGKVFGHGVHALDYTESGHKSRRQNLMRSITPEVKTVEHPVELLDGQDDRLVGHIRCCLESLGLQALEPKTEAVAFPVQNLHAVAGFVEEDEQHGVEHCHPDIQLDHRSQPSMDFRKSTGLGYREHFFDFCIGSYHGRRAPEGIGSTASDIS